MRLTTTLLFVFGCIAALRAQPLPNPRTAAPLYAHLCEVNREWLSQASPAGLTDDVQFPTDIHRVQRHLQLVETTLAQRPTGALTPTQRHNRAATLAVLKKYGQAAKFPTNLHHTERVPVFVDERGTACAVGYLLLATGEAELMAHIHATHNYATIAELLVYPEIQTWADEHGFTTDELAWIQPGYAVVTFLPKAFGNNLGTEGGYVKVMQAAGDELFFAGDFTHIDGFEATSIAAWDGGTFRALPGLTGGIDRLGIDAASGSLLAVGAFPGLAAPADTVLLAQYVGGVWVSLLTQGQVLRDDAPGMITDVVCQGGTCLLSGDFTHLDGQPISRLARYDLGTQQWQPAMTALTFTDRIADIDWRENQVLVGGTFLLMSGADTVSQLVARLDVVADTLVEGVDVLTSHLYYEGITSVDHVGFASDEIWLAIGRSDDGSGVALYKAWINELWGLPLSGPTNAETSYCNGIHQGQDVFGTFEWNDNHSMHGIMRVPGGFGASGTWLATANAPVTAMTWYGDQYIIAGEFTSIGDSLFQHLTCATLRVSDTDATPAAPAFTLGTDGVTLFLDHIPSTSAAIHLELFDMQGRRSWQYTLPQGATKHQVALPSLPSGAYAYRVYGSQLISAGQVVAIGLRQ